MSFVAFHGADGDTLLDIVRSGVLRPRNGEIYLSANRETTYAHGADRRRRASFALELRIPDVPLTVRRIATQGVPLTICIDTADQVPIEVVRLHVRRRDSDGQSYEEIIPAHDIERYLQDVGNAR